MNFKLVQIELPKIIYDNSISIFKSIENNTPIKRTIRREIYNWLIDELYEYKNQKRHAFLCLMLKGMCYHITSIDYPEAISRFNLNDKKQNIFPELNINKIKRYAIKHKIKIYNTNIDGAWFDATDYYTRIDILRHCINTIDKNVKREKRVASSTGGNNIKTNNIK